MAIMYPSSIADYNPTKSEREFYERLRDNLNDNYRVFYSIKWFTEKNGIRANSESDFLIFDPTLGYLCIEVKGGRGIEREGDKWKLILSEDDGEKEERDLTRSPYLQAEESMWYFREYYVEQFNNTYKGVYGSAVAFPNFNYIEMGPDAPKFLTIDYDDMSNLEYRIKEIFNYWRGKHNHLVFTKDQRERFISLIHKRVSLSAAAGALIEYRNKQLEVINRVQDNYIDFLSHYNQAYITGGAGTGKTWIAI
ncbi:MAG: NERD domain-containing protein, partial [Tenericutes bacterium]|nr:NERD domain-containing protein [Mycoplasmatota bacterium]